MRQLLEAIHSKAEIIKGLLNSWKNESKYWEMPNISFSTAEVVKKSVEKRPSGNYLISATIRVAPHRSHAGGFYYEGLSRGYEYDKDIVDAVSVALEKNLATRQREIEGDAKEVLLQTWRVLSYVFGWKEKDEWVVDEDSFKWGSFKWGKPDNYFKNSVAIPLEVSLTFEATPKADERNLG